MKKQAKMYSLSEIDTITDLLYSLHSSCKVYTFAGDLGAGKTTLIKALLKRWGVQDVVTSPTFNYVNVYTNQQGERLYHFDLYRLEDLQEFVAMGFDEYLYQNNSYAFIEWPEIIRPLLKHNVCNIMLDFESEDQRIIKIACV